VQRWVGYVLKRGHQELRLSMKGGARAKLDDLASLLHRQKPDFGVNDADSLRSLLETTDHAGRFEFDGEGCVRKVPHNERLQKAAGPPRAEEIPISQRRAVSPSPPPPPGAKPGKHWTTYRDGANFWFYYEGPKGRWWCQERDETPEVFLPDDEESGDGNTP